MLTVLAGEGDAAAAGGGLVASLLPLVLIAAAFWFLLVRPQRNRARRMAEVQQAVSVGDEVVTHGGLVGRITEATEAEVVLETTPGVHLRFLRGAVGTVRSGSVGGDDLDVPPQQPPAD